jgi:hypothetical protein
MPLTILLCLCHGLTLCLMVGPWSGTRLRPTQILPSDIMPRLAWYPYWRRVQWPCFELRCHDWKPKLFCNNFHQLGTDVTFEHSCNIPACDGNCISGLAFVRGTLFDPAFGDLSGRYPTGQRITPLKYVGALESGLAYLSRCNSGWFCHTEPSNSSQK